MNDQDQMNIITVQNVDSAPFEIVYDGKPWGSMEPGQIRRMPKFLAEHAVKHLIDQILNRLEKPTNNQFLRKEWASKIVIDEEQSMQPRQQSEEERLAGELRDLNKQSDLENILNRHRERETAAAQVLSPAPLDPTPPSPTPTVPQPLPVVESVNETPAAPQPTPEVPAPPVATAPAEQVPAVVEPTPVPETPPAPSQVEAAPQAPIIPATFIPQDNVVDTTIEAAPVTDPTTPDRNALYAWARDNMHMDLNDAKTMQALDATPVEQLVEDLQYSPA